MPDNVPVEAFFAGGAMLTQHSFSENNMSG